MSYNVIDFNSETTAGKLSAKAFRDNTKYNALEVGHAMTEDIGPELRKCAESNSKYIDQDEFCVIMLISKDNVLTNLIRRKFFAWPFLPKPRPNQAVLLYNKKLDMFTKRLWVLPSDVVMAELHELSIVHKNYQSMKRWTDEFYRGWRAKKVKGKIKFYNVDPCHFWDYIRKENDIKLLSEYEYVLAHRNKLLNTGSNIGDLEWTKTDDVGDFFGDQIVHSNIALSN